MIKELLCVKYQQFELSSFFNHQDIDCMSWACGVAGPLCHAAIQRRTSDAGAVNLPVAPTVAVTRRRRAAQSVFSRRRQNSCELDLAERFVSMWY